MKRLMSRIGAVAAGCTILVVPTAAQAYDTGQVPCAGGSSICVNSFYHNVSGSISVTVDIAGPSTTKARWQLIRPNGTVQCYGDIVPKEAAKTLTCHAVGIGQYQIRMYSPNGNAWIRVRY